MHSVANYTNRYIDPIEFGRHWWPHVNFYDKQRELIYSAENNVETYLKSANQMGKDFTTAFIMLKQFLCNPVARIVPTSIKDDHLRVLEGETLRFINTARFPLRTEDGGPLIVNHRDIRKITFGERCPISYVRFMVSEKGEGLAGHHAPYTMVVGDEASGLDDNVKVFSEGWAKRSIWFGNPHHTENFYRRGCDGGDVMSDCGEYYLRKVITMRAEDSPNVRVGIARAKLKLPQEEPIWTGVLSYQDYLFRKKMWDPIRKCVGLDAMFYVGAEILLYPPQWLAVANEWCGKCPPMTSRKAKAIGVDPAEGGDETAICAVDEWGVMDLVAVKTPDTAKIMSMVLAVARKTGCPTSMICFDRGGGGKQIADRMREAGYPVSTVAFNEAVNLPISRVRHQTEIRRENREDKSAYTNRRQEMYGTLSDAIDPSKLLEFDGRFIAGARIFAIPPASAGPQYAELIRQMQMVPKKYDTEGQLKVPPKRKKETAAQSSANREKSLEEIMGCSPDELDSLAIAYWRMNNKLPTRTAGAIV